MHLNLMNQLLEEKKLAKIVNLNTFKIISKAIVILDRNFNHFSKNTKNFPSTLQTISNENIYFFVSIFPSTRRKIEAFSLSIWQKDRIQILLVFPSFFTQGLTSRMIAEFFLHLVSPCLMKLYIFCHSTLTEVWGIYLQYNGYKYLLYKKCKFIFLILRGNAFKFISY